MPMCEDSQGGGLEAYGLDTRGSSLYFFKIHTSVLNLFSWLPKQHSHALSVRGRAWNAAKDFEQKSVDLIAWNQPKTHA